MKWLVPGCARSGCPCLFPCRCSPRLIASVQGTGIGRRGGLRPISSRLASRVDESQSLRETAQSPSRRFRSPSGSPPSLKTVRVAKKRVAGGFDDAHRIEKVGACTRCGAAGGQPRSRGAEADSRWGGARDSDICSCRLLTERVNAPRRSRAERATEQMRSGLRALRRHAQVTWGLARSRTPNEKRWADSASAWIRPAAMALEAGRTGR
jgi:hypothetical protein